MSLNAFDVLGWDKNDDAHSDVVNQKRIAAIDALVETRSQPLRDRIAELEAELEKAKAPAKHAAKSAAKSAADGE